MAWTYALVYTDDPLGLADEDKIIINDYDTGVKAASNFIETRKANNLLLEIIEANPADAITCNYELHSSASLVLAFGAAVNTNYILTGATINVPSDNLVTVSVNALKLSAIGKVDLVNSATLSITVSGGMGIAKDYSGEVMAGALTTAGFVSHSVNVTVNPVETFEGGDYKTDGYLITHIRRAFTLETLAALASDPDWLSLIKHTKPGKEALKLFSYEGFLEAHMND